MEFREAGFETGEVALNYAEGPSNGRPFVVLHGGAGRWQHGFRFLELMTQTWHVYAPDFRGHGKSGHVPGAYHLGEYVRDIVAFLAGVVQEPAVVYGHSMGGEVGVMVAAQRPDLVHALIVGDAPLSRFNRATEEPAHRAQNVLWHRLAGQLAAEIEPALRNMPIPVPGESALRPAREVMGEDSPWYAHQAVSLHQLDPDVLAAVLAGPEAMLDGYEPDVVLPAIVCPVLLLQADAKQGSALPDAEVSLGLQLLSRASVVRMEGLGHPLHAISPMGVFEAISPFLSGMSTHQLTVSSKGGDAAI
jgi:pimeloyl-ACP methyl ester carboxylesterase